MKRILLSLAFVSTTAIAFSQTYSWAIKDAAGGASTGYDMATDASGNSYVTGYFGGTFTIGATTLTAAGGDDIFTAKLDPAGALLWLVSGGGTGNDEGQSLVVDGSGNVFVLGYMNGTCNFGSTSLTSNGAEDIFLVKYDATGAVVWAHNYGSAAMDFGNDLAIDPTGNLYVVGSIGGNATFGSIPVAPSGLEDALAFMTNGMGVALWGISAGASSSDAYADAVAIDGSGNLYMGGSFSGDIIFGSDTMHANGMSDGFVAKLTSAPGWGWDVAISGTGNQERVGGLACDASNAPYITGTFDSTVAFGVFNLTAGGFSDGFVGKMNAGSGAFTQVKQIGGPSSDMCGGVSLDGSNNVYVTGTFSSTATFGSGSPQTSAGGMDAFCAKYAPTSLTTTWVKTGGGPNDETGWGIAASTGGHCWFTGDFNGFANFGTSISLTGASSTRNAFVAKLSNPVGVKELSEISVLNIAPNPAADLIQINLPEGINNGTIHIYNSIGQLVMIQSLVNSSTISIEEFSAGLYTIQLISEGKSFAGQLVKE